jgi:dipeptidyl aminopeptidase/acylaminoacyl peptidase
MVTKSLVREAAAAEQPSRQDPAPLRVEELADRIVPIDPRIAPDGARVAFVADPVSQKEERRKRALWLAATDDPARQLTAGTSDDNDPRWSPDGARLLFRSDRQKTDEEEWRLFLLPLQGGEAAPLGELAGELSQAEWSPDGARIAVLRRDPESAADKARKKERDDAVVVEEEPRFTRLWIVDADSGKARCLTTSEREVRGYAWTPEGDALVIVTTAAPETDALLGAADLWRVPAAGGLPGHIARFPSTPWSPVVVPSPDGPVVVVGANGLRQQPSDSVWVVPINGGEPRNLLPDLLGVVEAIAPLPGHPGQIAARIVERTRGRLYAVDVASGAMTPLTPPAMAERGSVVEGASFSADGRRLAAVWSDATTPEEVWLGDTGGHAAAATRCGASFRDRLQPTEHVTWRSDDGVEIEGMLTYPMGYETGSRYPLFIQVHGGPSSYWEDRVLLDWHDWAQLLASRGYAVLMPNPRGSTGYGHDFQQLLQDDVGGGEYRDLVAGAQAMVARGIADPHRLGIGGWSWGGFLTAWTITQTNRFRAAIVGAGVANMISDHAQGDIPTSNLRYFPGQPYAHMDAYWAASPIRHVAAARTPTLILHGDDDARVAPGQGMELFRALKTLGVPVRFVRYPREKHHISERAHQIDLMQRVLDWLERYLMNGSSGVPSRAET